jgi:hypothetical protein
VPEFASIPYAGPAAARFGSYAKQYMVVHCTANNASPADEAAYARRRTDGVGMHFVSDPVTVLQVLESWYGTGHVGSTTGNRYGISWEFVGFLTSTPEYYRRCIDRAAPSMRLVMAKHGIPHRWLTDAQLRAGTVKGLVTHLQCSRVLGGSNHTDPGPNFGQQYLIDALNGDQIMAEDHYQDPTVRTMAQRVDALVRMDPEFEVEYDNDPGTPKTPERNELAAELTRHGAQLAELLTRPPVQSAPVDLPSLVAALRPVIAEESERAVRKVLGAVDGAVPPAEG